MSDSQSQQWNPTQYAENARFVSDLGMPVVALLSPQANEHILDLGCGDGALTIKLMQLGCDVIGVDSSPDMITAAKTLGLNANVMNGEALTFNNQFDAVFSNAALHWMKKPETVIEGVWRSLKPGGRFVAEFGGYGNVATIVNAIESALASRGLPINNPWFFPEPSHYRALLEAKGFSIASLELIQRPTPLPGDVGAWLETFAQSFLAVLPADERKSLIYEVVEALRPSICDANGNWVADYVRLRFFARKEITAS